MELTDAQRAKLVALVKELQNHYKWPGGELPSGAWIAEKAGKKDLYDYLHAATSRSLHFSAGEIMRRGWGIPRAR